MKGWFNKQWIEKDVQGPGITLIWDIIPEFVWGTKENQESPESE
jgi:hypothetical protein